MARDHGLRERHLRGERRRPPQRHHHPDHRGRGYLLSGPATYLEFFGLAEAPFRPTADARWVFPDRGYEVARAALACGLAERRGLVCLIGEAGTGKTLLLRQLEAQPPPGLRPLPILHPGLEFDELIELVGRSLGYPLADVPPARRLADLRAAIAADARAAGALALLVDEAQALPSATLSALPRLIVPVGSGLQVVLGGQPPLEARLEQAGLGPHVAVRAHLEPLAPSAVTGYLAFRLARAGAGGADLLTPDAVTAIARLTRGVPRLVNTIAEASLVEAFAAGARRVSAEHVKAAWRGHTGFGPTAMRSAASALDEPTQVATPREAHGPLPFEPPTRTTAVPASRRVWPALLAVGAAAALAAVVLLRGGSVPPPAPVPVASAPAPRPVVAAAPTPEALPTPTEALALVDAFRRAYEARDATALLPLLAADAEERDRRGKLDVVAAHARLLDRLEMVDYVQPDARLEPRAGGIEVRAPFVLRFRDPSGRGGEVRGSAAWRIARRDGVPRITALRRDLAPDTHLPDDLAVLMP